MNPKELQQILATPEGKQALAAHIDGMGKDALRQALMELVVVVVDLAEQVDAKTEVEAEQE